MTRPTRRAGSRRRDDAVDAPEDLDDDLALDEEDDDADLEAPEEAAPTRRAPKRSPIHPEAGIHMARLSRYAVEVHCTVEIGAWNSRAMVGIAWCTEVEAIATILPQPRSRSGGSAARTMRTEARKLASNALRNASSSTSSARPTGGPAR